MRKNITVDDKLISDLSKLARLKFDGKSYEKMKSDLKKIIEFVDAISELDTKKVDPLIYISEEVNVLRNDNVIDNISQRDALKNAPQKDSDYFKVPKVLKK
tara:strand:+ start:3057 stop:3359 length:303 start_codon:yes stop_codon:yes gene_type:complete